MTQYIDKAAVVAEIERRKQKLLDHIICESDKEWVVRTAHQLNRILLFLDTLEVKEGSESEDLEETPEKLYIALNELTEDGRTFVLDHRVDYPICTEYTRTDTFIEKACEFIAGNMKCSIYTTQTKAKFIKEFRNYMKGE